MVHSAGVRERAGAQLVLAGIQHPFPQLGPVRVDGGYVNAIDTSLVGWAAGQVGIDIVAVQRNADVRGFQVGAPPARSVGECPGAGWWNGASPG